jgi:hypothetical protein
MAARNRKARKAGERRLADMSGAAQETEWRPLLPPDPPYYETIYIDENRKVVQSLGFDERNRLAEWAVIQMRRRRGEWKKIAVYDNCHFKGAHRHLYNQREERFDEKPIMPIRSYADVEKSLDHVMEWLKDHWQENERRSDRGR